MNQKSKITPYLLVLTTLTLTAHNSVSAVTLKEQKRLCHLTISRLARAERTETLAKEAGLKVVFDHSPGITRELIREIKNDDGSLTQIYHYRDSDGKRITTESRDQLLQRLKDYKIAIPPAWKNVWISPDPEGHIQVTGLVDSETGRGPKKQSIYHPRWNEAREDHKFGNNTHFGRVLGEIRERAKKDLKGPGLSKNQVLAAAVLLLDSTHIRVGNEESGKFGNYGLSTLLKKHIVEYGDEEIRLRFRGKSGVQQDLEKTLHPELKSVLDKLLRQPGKHLLQYIDENGEYRLITPQDINIYLNKISGNGFTAKSFRTWWATSLATQFLASEFPIPKNEKEAKSNWLKTRDFVSEVLGNKPAQAEKSYIDPLVKQTYLNDPESFQMIFTPQRGRPRKSEVGLGDIEQRVLRFLEYLHGENK